MKGRGGKKKRKEMGDGEGMGKESERDGALKRRKE